MMGVKKRLEQEENDQHVQDMPCRVAGGIAKGHIHHRCVCKKKVRQHKSGVEQTIVRVSSTKDGGRKVALVKGGKRKETTYLGQLVLTRVVVHSVALKRAVMLRIVHTWVLE
jgi:hypothetical protein